VPERVRTLVLVAHSIEPGTIALLDSQIPDSVERVLLPFLGIDPGREPLPSRFSTEAPPTLPILA
jgi:hypothetical protein